MIGFDEAKGLIATVYKPQVGDLIGFALRDEEGARTNLKLTLEEMERDVRHPPAFGLVFRLRLARQQSVHHRRS